MVKRFIRIKNSNQFFYALSADFCKCRVRTFIISLCV